MRSFRWHLVKCGNIYSLSYELAPNIQWHQCMAWPVHKKSFGKSWVVFIWTVYFFKRVDPYISLSRENWVHFTFILSKAELPKSFHIFLASFAGDQRQVLSLCQWGLSLKTTWEKHNDWKTKRAAWFGNMYTHTHTYILTHSKKKENHNKIKLIEKETLDPEA